MGLHRRPKMETRLRLPFYCFLSSCRLYRHTFLPPAPLWALSVAVLHTAGGLSSVEGLRENGAPCPQCAFSRNALCMCHGEGCPLYSWEARKISLSAGLHMHNPRVCLHRRHLDKWQLHVSPTLFYHRVHSCSLYTFTSCLGMEFKVYL